MLEKLLNKLGYVKKNKCIEPERLKEALKKIDSLRIMYDDLIKKLNRRNLVYKQGIKND